MENEFIKEWLEVLKRSPIDYTKSYQNAKVKEMKEEIITNRYEGQKIGVKLTIIDQIDFKEYKEIIGLLESKGYKAVLVDNGNTVLTKV